MPSPNAETSRMRARDDRLEAWDLWGPYLSDRQWGTVREDYSEDGRAWEYFPFEHSAARAYRWGEDGLLGICDSDCRLCFAPALWNGRDPILKERPFGLANGQGNHGEDVKDYYFHLDATPTASYLAGLYKYPQREFPYRQLLEENARRSRLDPEFELCDTGVFAEGRYFDILVEYAKAAPADILIRISAANRGPERATLHLLPTLWFRNTWSWGEPGATKPEMHLNPEGVISAAPWEMPVYHLYCDGEAEFLFTENETNAARIFGARITPRFSKDAFHEAVIAGRRGACNPANFGTKAAAWRRLDIGPGESAAVRLRLCLAPQPEPFGPAFDETFAARRREA
ncbi:MAG: hypothetical protein N2322_01405, partial [Terrimicrobiaceae bacterium]|nr:hypothetical protein [Terrimicrobiaceae bacterium]